MAYVIRVNSDGEEMYVYSSKVLVHNVGYAKRFYSKAYVVRYIKTHAGYSKAACEIITVNS